MNRKSIFERTIQTAALSSRREHLTKEVVGSAIEPIVAITTENRLASSYQRGRISLKSGYGSVEMIKPALIEKRFVETDNFAQLSNSFKQIFGNDVVDRKMVVPVSGYGGHRRGDKSQNFFGKSFRETALQSKQLERRFRSNSMVNA